MSSDELVARLRPWHAALRTLGAPFTDVDPYKPRSATVLPPYTLWINDKYLMSTKRPRSAKLPTVRIYEAVALLGLLARVDVRAWKATVVEVWPTQDTQTWLDDHTFTEDTAPAEFKVGIVLRDVASAKHIDRLAKLCNSTEKDVVSPEFTQLYASIEAPFGRKATTWWEIPLRLDLELFAASLLEVTACLKRILHYVEKCRRNVMPANVANKALIQIEELEVDSGEYLVLDSKDLAIWKRISDSGVRVSHFPDIRMSESEYERKQVIEAARLLMNVPERARGHDASRVRGVHTVCVTTEHSPGYVPCILSAAQLSASLRVADIEIVPVDDEEPEFSSDEDDEVEDRERPDTVLAYWKWIAYALFSRHARHQLTTLQMQICDLRPAHVEAMGTIITAPDPLAQLHDLADRREQLRQISASHFHLNDPYLGFRTNAAYPNGMSQMCGLTQQRSGFATDNPITVRVISPPRRDDDPYWKVLLPGQGDSWVHRDEMTDLTETALPTDDWQTAVPSFECIELMVMNDESKDAALEFLQLIGRGTKCVSMYEYETEDDDNLDDWVRAVLVTCPRLEELIMGVVMIRSMDVFVETAQAGVAHLKRLVLGYAGCDHVETFFELLSDDSSTLRLQSLRVNFWIEQATEVDRVLAASLQMLERNRRLYEVQIGFRLDERFVHVEKKVHAAFTSVSKEKVAVRVAPFDSRCKFAFLSTIQHNACCRGDGIPALAQLDNGVIGTVFEFAAQSRIRRVVSKCVTVG